MAENSYTRKIYQIKITEIRLKMPFIKIITQNINTAKYQNLKSLIHLYSTNGIAVKSKISLGAMCIAKIGKEICRCRVLEFDKEGLVSLDFIDNGFVGKLPVGELKLLPTNHQLSREPSICKEFVLAGVIIETTAKDYREKLKKMYNHLHNNLFEMVISGKIDDVSFVDLLTSGEGVLDIIEHYPTLKSILKPIKLFDQIQLYTQLINQPANFKLQREIMPESPERKNLPEPLKVGSEHQVIITSYENGPRNFSVRFVTSFHDKFDDFRKLLNAAMLIPLHSEPLIGGIYLSESVIDPNASNTEIVRVVVKEIHHDLVLVSSIDFGWSRIINNSNLYEISRLLKNTPPFASQFVLENIENVAHLNDEELNFYFKYITKNHRLQLQVAQSEAAATCSLKDTEINVDILDMIKAYDPRTLTFGEQKALKFTEYKVCVSHIDNESTFFYVQLFNQSITVVNFYNDILKDLITCSLKFPSLGNACFVKLKDDFYRGQIVKRVTPSIWRVRMIDYGFEEDFMVGDIQVLVENFVKDPPCAYKCRLLSYDTDQMALMNANSDEPIKMVVKSFKDDAYYVELAPMEKENDKSFVLEESDFSIQSSIWDLQTDSDMNACILTSVDSTKFFTIQAEDTTNSMKNFQKEMQRAGNISMRDGPLPIDEVVQKKLFMVTNPETKSWCRVFVHEILDSHFLMRDCDTGSKFPISKHEVYKAPIETKAQLSFAISCSLPCRVKKNQKRAAYEYLLKLRNRKLFYKHVFADENTNIIELFDEKKLNIVNEMVGLRIVDPLLAPPSATCFITYVHNLGEFYIMLKDDDKNYNNFIKEFCVERYDYIEADNIEKGMKVMAKYSVDGAWYRAKVLKKIEDKFEVFYIDFGNKSVVEKKDIGLVDESNDYILQTRSLTVRCSLNLPGYDLSSERAVQYLKALANKGFREFVYETIKSGKKSIIVRLKDTNGSDIVQWEKLCEPSEKDKTIYCPSETESSDNDE